MREDKRDIEIMETKKKNLKRNYLMSFCSLNVVNTILFYDKPDGPKLVEKAKEIAKSKGRNRIWVEDWEDALNG